MKIGYKYAVEKLLEHYKELEANNELARRGDIRVAMAERLREMIIIVDPESMD